MRLLVGFILSIKCSGQEALSVLYQIYPEAGLAHSIEISLSFFFLSCMLEGSSCPVMITVQTGSSKEVKPFTVHCSWSDSSDD